MVMERIPLVASVEELDEAIEYADQHESTRWFVARRAQVLGRAERIPEHWGYVRVTADTEPEIEAESLVAGGLVVAVQPDPFSESDVFDSLRTSIIDYVTGMYGMDTLTASIGDVANAAKFSEVELEEPALALVASFYDAGQLDSYDRHMLEEALTAAVRHVRTAEGAEYYGQPIGSVIVPNIYLPMGSKSVKDLKPGDFINKGEKTGEKRKVHSDPVINDDGTVSVAVVDEDGKAETVKMAGNSRWPVYKSAPKGAKAVLAEPPSPQRDPAEAKDREQSTYDPSVEEMTLEELKTNLDEIQSSDDPDVEAQEKLVAEIDKREGFVTKTDEETAAQAAKDIAASTRLERLKDEKANLRKRLESTGNTPASDAARLKQVNKTIDKLQSGDTRSDQAKSLEKQLNSSDTRSGTVVTLTKADGTKQVFTKDKSGNWPETGTDKVWSAQRVGMFADDAADIDVESPWTTQDWNTGKAPKEHQGFKVGQRVMHNNHGKQIEVEITGFPRPGIAFIKDPTGSGWGGRESMHTMDTLSPLPTKDPNFPSLMENDELRAAHADPSLSYKQVGGIEDEMRSRRMKFEPFKKPSTRITDETFATQDEIADATAARNRQKRADAQLLPSPIDDSAKSLEDRLTEAGHNVSSMSGDPFQLKNYAKAIGFEEVAAPSSAVSTGPTAWVGDGSKSLGTIKADAKGNDPERFIPKVSLADGTTPAKGARVRDKKGRVGSVEETYQAYTAVRWDDTGKMQTVKNDRLNSSGGATGATTRPAPGDVSGKAGESTKKAIDNSPTVDTGGEAQLPDTLTPNPIATLTDDSHNLFKAFWDDAGNWSGVPWVDGNVGIGSTGRGNLTDLKRKKLLITGLDDGDAYVMFTNKGVDYAAAAGWDPTEADSWSIQNVEGYTPVAKTPDVPAAPAVKPRLRAPKTDEQMNEEAENLVFNGELHGYTVKGLLETRNVDLEEIQEEETRRGNEYVAHPEWFHEPPTPYVTVKVPGYTEVGISTDLARRELGLPARPAPNLTPAVADNTVSAGLDRGDLSRLRMMLFPRRKSAGRTDLLKKTSDEQLQSFYDSAYSSMLHTQDDYSAWNVIVKAIQTEMKRRGMAATTTARYTGQN